MSFLTGHVVQACRLMLDVHVNQSRKLSLLADVSLHIVLFGDLSDLQPRLHKEEVAIEIEERIRTKKFLKVLLILQITRLQHDRRNRAKLPKSSNMNSLMSTPHLPNEFSQ